MLKRTLAMLLAGILLTSNTVVYATENTEVSFAEEHLEEENAEDEAVLDEKAAVEETEEDEITEESAEEENAADDVVEDIEKEETIEEAKEEFLPDERTGELAELYVQWLENPTSTYAAVTADYATELAKFPADYQELIKNLHEKHPNWVFCAVNTGLDWNDVVKGESAGTRNLISTSYSKVLLSNDSEDYNAATGKYVIRDGSSWVNASDPAIAYFVDPRNYLNERYIFAMERQDYDSKYHTLDGVERVLKGTDLANKVITYVDTNGKTITLNNLTYGQAILAAGAANDINPIFLASKIKQETGGKLSNGSISGTFSYNSVSYQGYYNYYNIGATAVASGTGSAVANGLSYAKQSGSYQRPWTSPVLAIQGGAEFLVKSYIEKGQNTGYFQKFNTVYKPYYNHQYMQNVSAAMSEGSSTYAAYQSYNMLDNTYVFYVPVYNNMPSRTENIVIDSSVNTAKVTVNEGVKMRSGPSTSYSRVTSIPKNATVTVSEIVFTDDTVDTYSKLSYPYWAKVTYGNTTGYVCNEYLKADEGITLRTNGTATITLAKSVDGERVYYETSNPAVATVSDDGIVTAVGKGSCMIYAITSSAQSVDMIGVGVIDSIEKPELISAVNVKDGIALKWKETAGAEGYHIYRKTAGEEWSKIGTVSSGNTLTYTDLSSSSGVTYTYTVEAYTGNDVSGYSQTGLTKLRLSEPQLKSVETTKNTAKVTWNKVEGASGYYVYRKDTTGSWTLIGTVSNGSVVSYTEDGLTPGMNYVYTVKAYNGNDTSTYSINGISGTTLSKTYTSYKTTERLNYRTGPGTSYSKGGTFAKGVTLQVEDGYAVKANGYTWYRIKYNTKEYYVASDYLTKITSGSGGSGNTTPAQPTYTSYKTTYRLNYRTGPGTSYSRVGTLASGAVVQVEDGYAVKADGYTWYRFKYNGKDYYLASNYVVKVTGSSSSSSSNTTTYTKYTTTYRVNYRTGPGTSYTRVGTLAKGVAIQVEDGYSKTADGYKWYRFKYNSKTYYIASNYLKK